MIYFDLNSLNKIKNVPDFFLTPLVYAIGNACEEIKIAQAYTLKRKKKLIILHPYNLTRLLRYKICNRCIFTELYSYEETFFDKTLKKILNFLVDKEFIVRRLFFILIKKFTNKNLSKYNFPIIGIEKIFGTKKNIQYNKEKFIEYENIKKFSLIKNNFNINYDIERYCEIKLNEYKIPYERLVLIHVRDDQYRNDKNRKDYRNSNINKYIESIKYLIENNYFVMRVGRRPSNKIYFEHNNFLDYSSLDIQEDNLDIFLMKKTKFFLGTQSGILDLAQLFNKPILQTIMVEIFSKYPIKINDRGIFKKIKKKGEFLSISDYVKLNYRYHNPSNDLNDLIFYENTEEELLLSVKEFLDIQKNPTLTFNQNKFNQFILNEHKKHFNQNPHELFTEYDSLKLIRLVKNAEGCLTNINLKNLNFI